MRSGISPINSAVASRNTLALAIAAVAQSDGDYTTAIPALSLHRRNMPTAPMHCIYGLGLGVVAQGGKQVMLGGEVIDYGPGQSMLTTVDLPVVAHVTRASVREPFLGMMLGSRGPHHHAAGGRNRIGSDPEEPRLPIAFDRGARRLFAR